MKKRTIYHKYPPSEPCSCQICTYFCRRPGWWTPEQVSEAIKAGFGRRMMLEISPELNFGVLSPAFSGCEGQIASAIYANNGCNFLVDGLCELHSTPYIPLECSYCHHDRMGQGQRCHLELEKLWRDSKAQSLIKRWGDEIGLWNELRKVVSGKESHLRAFPS